jgi:tetratricopeptide (TPR) repeat protein
VLTWYLETADAADRVLAPHRPHVLPDDQIADARVPRFDSYEHALAWCEAELAALASAVRLAAEEHEYGLAWQLPTALFGFYRLRRSWQDWLDQQRIGLDAALKLGEERGEAWIFNGLGITYTTLGRYDEAHQCFTRSLEIRRRRGDRAGESYTLNNLGEYYRHTGQMDRAIACYEQDQRICQELSDWYGASIGLNNLGKAQLAIGRAVDALASQQTALRLCRMVGDLTCEGEILDDLGHVYRRLGRGEDAIRNYDLAIATYLRAGCDIAAADTMSTIASLLYEEGRVAEALQRAREATGLLDSPAAASADGLGDRIRRQLAAYSDTNLV